MSITGISRFVIAILVVCHIATAYSAVYCDWIGADGGDFWDASNWRNGIVPNVSDRVGRFNTDNAIPGTVVMTNAPGSDFSYLYFSSGEWTLKVVGTSGFGGDYDNASMRVTGAGSKLTLKGCEITNTCFQAENGGQIVFDNCVTRGCLTHRRLNSAQTNPDAYVFRGGKHDFRTMYMRLYQKASFDGGDFTFGSIYGYDSYGEGKQNRLPSYLSLTGGRLSITGENKINVPASIGITVSGNGWYRNFVEHGNHWLADRGTYVWRIEDNALIDTPGIYLSVNYDSTTSRIEVAGGRFHLKSSIGGNDLTDKKRSSAIVFDGGTIDCDFAVNTEFHGSAANDTSGFSLCVGENGGCLRNRKNVVVTVDRKGFMNAQDVSNPGTLVLDGYGKIYLNQTAPGTFSGTTKIRGYVHSDMSSCAFGTGDIELADGGILYTSGNAANNAVTYSGASYIWTDNATGRMTIPSLTRKDGGILMLRSTAPRTVYGTEDNARYLSVQTAPELRSNGLPVDPIILMSSEPDNGIIEAHLVNWDGAKKRFVGAEYATDIYDAVGKVVYQDGAFTPNSDISVGALVLRGQVAGGSKKISIGDGEGVAMAVLNPNSRGSSSQISNWTLDFGTSRGVVTGGTKVSDVDSGSASLNGYITGSGGVDFAYVHTGGIILYRKQNWTGGTRVMSGEVLLQNSGNYNGALPDGEVQVVGGERSGGSIRFQVASTHGQNYTISGFGAAYAPANKRGALSFEKDVELTGNITLSNTAMIGAADGYAGTLSGSITGSGDLYLGGTARTGAIVLSGGIDLDGDIHVDTCVTNSGSINLDGRFIYLNGTLVFNNTQDIEVNAKVIGEGRIVLAGSGKVDFADISVFDGVIDVAGNENAQIGALYGIATVANSEAVRGKIEVAGTSDYGFFGSVLDGIDLLVSGKLPVGCTADIHEDAGLSLSGGEVMLYWPKVFASLSGNGTVSGARITVKGPVTPIAEGHEDALSFSEKPEFLNGVPEGWTLHGSFALRRTYGTTLVIR